VGLYSLFNTTEFPAGIDEEEWLQPDNWLLSIGLVVAQFELLEQQESE